MEAKRPRAAVSEEDVDRAVESLRESLATLRPVEGREVRPGDFAAIDYVASVGGKTLPQGKRENRLIEVGKGAVPQEIDQALAGMTAGEARTVEVSFPADHPDRQVAGQVVRFDVTLRAIREKLLPEANDDLAKEHGECSTLQELRARLRERIVQSLSREADEQVREQLIEELLRRNSFEVPKSLVDRQIEALSEELLARLGAQAEELRKDPVRVEKLREELRPRAERQVRAILVLDALVEQEGVAVSEEDVARRIDEIVSSAGEQAARVRTAYGDPAPREELRQRMGRERVLEKIIAAAQIDEVDAPGNVVARTAEKG
jgi:trigger factor